MDVGLSDKTLSYIRQTLSQYPEVESAIIFGSRAKGNFKNGSDIDLTLTGTEISVALLNKISSQLDDLSLPYTMDLSIFSFIENPDLILHIQRVGKVLYQREHTITLN